MSRAADRRLLVERIYGQTGDLARRIEQLVAQYGPKREDAETAWQSDDVWLITYADQFQDPGTRPLVSLNRFIRRNLPWITGVHILPFYPWSSDDGFSITDYSAVDERYGTWGDVAAIALDRRVIADAVINHLSSESDWFQRFLAGDPAYAGLFRTGDPAADLSAVVRPRTTPLLTSFDGGDGSVLAWTTFSADQVDLDYRTPATLLRVLDVILDYAQRGVRVVRLDAIAFLWKEEGTACVHLPQTHDIVRLIRACLDDTFPDVLLLSETNVPHEENISYLGDGTMAEAQIVYQFPLAPLTLHAAIMGDTEPLELWARTLDEAPRGTTYLNLLASHDGVGLRPAEGLLDVAQVEQFARRSTDAGGAVGLRSMPSGEAAPYELNSTWFDLVGFGLPEDEAVALHLATHAVMLAMAGIPAIYVHSLFGTHNDAARYAASGRARSLNRHKYSDVPRLEALLADPTSRQAHIVAGLGQMIRWRAASAAFHPSARQHVLDTPQHVFGLERTAPDGATARVYTNFGSEAVALDLDSRRWRAFDGRPVDWVESLHSSWLTSDRISEVTQLRSNRPFGPGRNGA